MPWFRRKCGQIVGTAGFGEEEHPDFRLFKPNSGVLGVDLTGFDSPWAPPRANSARGPSPTGPHYGFSYPAKFTNKNGPSLGPLLLVDAGGLSPNTWERIERLSSMWEQAKQGVGSERPRAGEPNFGMVFNPTRRSRTPLTENEVGAIRAAREAGETVTSIARRFEVHRLTVWERTRDLPVSK